MEYKSLQHYCVFSKACPKSSKMLGWLYSSLFIKIHPIKHNAQLLSEKGKILDRLRNYFKIIKRQKQQPEEMETFSLFSKRDLYLRSDPGFTPKQFDKQLFCIRTRGHEKNIHFFPRTLVKCRVRRHY